MKYLIIFIILIFSSCDYQSSDWEYVYKKPDFADFIGEWKIIEPTYKNLEEEYGLSIERNGRLIINADNTFTFEEMPAIFDFTKVFNPEYYFNADGACSFDTAQDVYWLRIRLNKSQDIPKASNNRTIIILRNSTDSSYRLKNRRIDEGIIIFEKVQ